MISQSVFQARKEKVKWRDVFGHQSTRNCAACRHFTPAHRFCEDGKFVTQLGATCRQFSKPKSKLKEKK